MYFQTFEDVQDHLDRLGLFHMDFELDRMIRALSALDLLEHAPFIAAQVVGTNGKGSTSTFLASLAQAQGLRVGLYTSPHFVTPRERIRINGHMLEAAHWPALATRIMQVAPTLTYFEFLTALALLAFADAGVDLVVLEAGLGGHYDATTAMPAQVVCFTPISMDHEAILGATLTAIASDKAEAMRPGMVAFTAPQEHDALCTLRRVATEKGVVLHELSESELASSLPRLGLAGSHQQINARLALRVWEHLAVTSGWSQNPDAVREGLATARLAGRLQSLPASADTSALAMLLDGAHNPHGLRALEAALDEADTRPCVVIFSCLADKNMDEMLPILCRLAKNAPILVPTIQDNERAMLGA
ncbi:MAG: cyanophycin synthetase, partial [Bilophila sp.]